MDKLKILNKIKLRRLALGLSQAELGKAISIGDSQYSKIEKGQASLTLEDLIILLPRLNLTFKDLDNPSEYSNEEITHLRNEMDRLKSIVDMLSSKIK